jgi:hypothetical protein
MSCGVDGRHAMTIALEGIALWSALAGRVIQQQLFERCFQAEPTHQAGHERADKAAVDLDLNMQCRQPLCVSKGG